MNAYTKENNMSKPYIYQENHISVLTPELRQKAKRMQVSMSFKFAGCTLKTAQDEILPYTPTERHSVFKCSKEKGTYNHHAGICKWKGKYYYVFSNNVADEDSPPQGTMLSVSEDGKTWSESTYVASGSVKEGVLIRTCCIMSWNDKLVVFVQRNWNVKPAVQSGMSANDDTVIECRIDAYVSENALNWQVHENIVPSHWMFEEPRLTKEGRLLAAGSHQKTCVPTVLLWPGDNPLEKPEIIYMPYHCKDLAKGFVNPRSGVFAYGEASWYQDDDGRIWMYMRDEGMSTKRFVSISEDGGRNWTEPMMSDMPDSMSRAYVGRLNDGRFFYVGNAVSQLLDRSKLILALSDDGATFNKMYILIDGDTEQSHEGALKCHGYQYPNCLVDGDKLFIGYSVNKEDMECGILDVSKI